MASNIVINDELIEKVDIQKEVGDNKYKFTDEFEKIVNNTDTSFKEIIINESNQEAIKHLQNQISEFKNSQKDEITHKYFQELIQTLKEEFQMCIKNIENDFRNKVNKININNREMEGKLEAIHNKIEEELQKPVRNVGHALKLDVEISAERSRQSFEKMEKNINFSHKLMTEMVRKQLEFGICAFKEKPEIVQTMKNEFQMGIKTIKHDMTIAIHSTNQKIDSIKKKVNDIQKKTSDIEGIAINIKEQLANMDLTLMENIDLDKFYNSTEYINCEKWPGQQPLHSACRLGRIDVVKKLIQNGESIKVKTNNHWTPLHFASYFGHLNIVKFLIDKNSPINKQDKNGQTAVFLASWQGHKSIVEYLCCNNASVHIKSKCNDTVLSVACLNIKNDMIKILKHHGAKN